MDTRTIKQLEHLRDMRVEEAMRPYEALKAMIALVVSQYPGLMRSYPYKLMVEALVKEKEGK